MTNRPNNERPDSALILLFKWAKWKQKDIPELSMLFNIPRGFKAGVPNVFWALPKNGYNGLFIMLLYKANKELYYSQKNWIGELSKFGYKVVVAKDHREAKDHIYSYYNK